MTYKLILLRHGESEWNEKNLFTGWVDVPLDDKGRAEATRGGVLIKQENVLPDVVHTSLLRREIMEVIRKYVAVDADAVKVDVVKDGEHDVLDISVSLPERGAPAGA